MVNGFRRIPVNPCFMNVFCSSISAVTAHDRRKTQQDLPEIHVEPDHRVMEANLERIAEKITRQQH